MVAIRNPQTGSARFSLNLTDFWPIVEKGLYAAAAAFLVTAGQPIIDQTTQSVPWLAMFSAATASALAALVHFLQDRSKL